MTAAAVRSAAPSAVAVRDPLRDELQLYADRLGALVPPGTSVDRLITSALAAVQGDTTGALSRCDPKSIALALARVAQWGLDVGVTAHLVPFGTTATPVADYKGLIELMCAAGARKVEAHVVREGDDFDWQLGTDARLTHRPGKTRGAITHAYAIITVNNMGMTQFEVMSTEEIDAIRHSRSKQWKGGTLPEWYARKTVIRRVAKYAPKHGAGAKRLAQVLAEEEVELSEVEPLSAPAGVALVESGADANGAVAAADDGLTVSSAQEYQVNGVELGTLKDDALRASLAWANKGAGKEAAGSEKHTRFVRIAACCDLILTHRAKVANAGLSEKLPFEE